MTAAIPGSILSEMQPVTEDDRNLIRLFNKLSQTYPKIKDYCQTLNVLSSEKGQADFIRTWLTRNSKMLAGISSLNLNSSGFTSVPTQIVLFENLYSIDLGTNQLNFGNNAAVNLQALDVLTKLRDVNLKGNQLSSLPPALQTKKLRKINISQNNFQELPALINQIEHADLKDNPFGLVGSNKRWDGSRGRVKEEALKLALLTPVVHSVGTVVNVIYRIVKLITLSHFWTPLFYDKPYHFTAQLKEVAYDIIRLLVAPILLIALEATSVYGYLHNPYKGVIAYSKLEQAFYGRELIGNELVDNIAFVTLYVTYKVFLVYCALKFDKYI